MSKILKSFDLSTETNRAITPVLKSKKSLKLSAAPSSKLIINRQENLNRNSLIPKNRSASILKQKPQIPLKNISPSRLSNLSPVLILSESKRKTNRKLMKNKSLQKSFFESRETLTDKAQDVKKDVQSLEAKLKEALRPTKGKKNRDFISAFRDCFIEVIQKDKAFASVLVSIKEGYEEFIKSLQDKNEIIDLHEKLKNLEIELSSKSEVAKSYEKKVERLAKENYELARQLERSEEICTELQKRLCNITRYDVSDLPKDEVKWKAVVLENQNYYQAFKKNAELLELYKNKETTLLQLILAVKEKGYPIEEIYNSVFSNSCGKQGYGSSCSSNSEFENIASSRRNEFQKPENVPFLDLLQISPQSFSSDSKDDNIY